MGQAFDEGGRLLAEAFGKTKEEVFAKLKDKAPDAAEVRIRSITDPVPGCDMAESPGPSEDCNKAYRELAATFLSRKIQDVENYLDGLKHLHRIAEKLEPNSPAEQVLWDALWHHHRRF